MGKFVEFFGPGVAKLSIADRATISNMCPEYGATVGFFPVDWQSLEYLKQTGTECKFISSSIFYRCCCVYFPFFVGQKPGVHQITRPIQARAVERKGVVDIRPVLNVDLGVKSSDHLNLAHYLRVQLIPAL